MLKALKSRSKAPASSLAKRLRNSTAAKESMPKFHQGLLVFTPFHHALPCFTLTFELLKEPLLVDLGRRDPHEDSSRLSRLKTRLVLRRVLTIFLTFHSRFFHRFPFDVHRFSHQFSMIFTHFRLSKGSASLAGLRSSGAPFGIKQPAVWGLQGKGFFEGFT